MDDDLVSDNRSVAPVIGFILLFAILILALTTYQAQIVPQENAATEFQHFQETRNEMVEIRNSISTAGQVDVKQFPDITLGTRYETRVLTVNPPPSSGTLRTSSAYNITITNESGTSTNVSTRFLQYQPNYFELDVGSIWYEHSVLYLDERDRDNGVSIIEHQNILKDETTRIVALQNEFKDGGTERITLELYPQENLSEGDGNFPTGNNLTVTIPTRLDNKTYWDDELGGKGGYQGVDINARADGIHALNLSVDSDDIQVNTVGARSKPNEDPAKNIDPVSGSGIGSGGTDSSDQYELTITVDSAGPGSPKVDVLWDGNSETVGAGSTETFKIPTGTAVDLEAIAPGGSTTFDGWNGDIAGENPNDDKITVTMDTDRSITGEFS